MRRGGVIVIAVLALLLLLFLGGGAWEAFGRYLAPRQADSQDAGGPARSPASAGSRASSSVPGNATREDTPADHATAAEDEPAARAPAGGPAPPPVDLDAVDRERDLHGIVVNAKDRPVAGAEVVAVSRPWLRLDTVNRTDSGISVDGPRTRTSSDGTFSIPLRRGTRAALRVTAAGFAPVVASEHLAGERVRIELGPAARMHLIAVDEAGDVLPGLRMRVASYPRAAGFVVDETVVTNAAGEAVFDGLPPRGVELDISLESYGRAKSAGAVAPADWGGKPHRVVFPSGRTLRGRVVEDEGGAPVANARVATQWRHFHETTTAADGTFVVRGWQSDVLDPLMVFADGHVCQAVQVGADSEFEVRLRRGVAVAGRVVDNAGRPVGGAFVEVLASARVLLRETLSFGDAVSDAEGRFAVTGLDPALPHVVVVAADGLGRLRQECAPPPMAARTDLGDLVLGPGHVIAGRVVDGAGEPIPSLTVTLSGPAASAGSVSAANRHANDEEVDSDDLGRFAFADLPPGEYELTAQVSFDTPGLSARAVLPPDADVVGVTLAPAASRKFDVHLADESGRPIAGIGVSVTAGSGAMLGLTDAQGIAHFEPGVGERVVALVLGPRWFVRELSRGLALVPEAATEVRYVAHEGAGVEGDLLDPDGKPVGPGVLQVRYADGAESVWLVRPGGHFKATAPKGVKFHAEFDGMSLKADAPATGDRYWDTGLTGSADGAAPAEKLVIRCERVPMDRTLTVKVVSPDGDTVPGAPVVLTSASGVTVRNVTSDAKGVARFEGLPARTLRLFAGAAGNSARSAVQRVVPKGWEVVLPLRRAAEIRGVVLRADGSSVKAGVRALFGDELGDSQDSAADGRFALRVPAEFGGPFRVLAWDAAGGTRHATVEGVAPGAAELRIVLPK